MPSRRLIALVTALSCLAAMRGAHASYSVEQLIEIERLIVSRDCGALRRYIDRNPTLLSGGDALSDELRSFAQGVDTGLISCLSFRDDSSTQEDSTTLVGSLVY
jgi:hypothetical protein